MGGLLSHHHELATLGNWYPPAARKAWRARHVPGSQRKISGLLARVLRTRRNVRSEISPVQEYRCAYRP